MTVEYILEIHFKEIDYNILINELYIVSSCLYKHYMNQIKGNKCATLLQQTCTRSFFLIYLQNKPKKTQIEPE